MGMILNAKQELFCQQYIIDHNAKQAAIRAGYAPDSAQNHGVRLTKDINIRLRILELEQDIAKSLMVTAEKVVVEVAAVAFAVSEDTVTKTKDGFIIGIPPDAPPGTMIVKTSDKLKALEALGRKLGMFNDKLAVSGHSGGPIETTYTIEFIE